MFSVDDYNLYQNNYINNNNNKIICIDIDLAKEQKKIQEQKEKDLKDSNEIKTYKKPTLSPSLDQGVHLKNKIDTITINNNQKIVINNNNINEEQFRQEIIMKLSIVSDNNLIYV